VIGVATHAIVVKPTGRIGLSLEASKTPEWQRFSFGFTQAFGGPAQADPPPCLFGEEVWIFNDSRATAKRLETIRNGYTYQHKGQGTFLEQGPDRR
jgi:hypothetical protein